MSIKNLPQCRLISVLKEKAESRQDIEFNFLGELDKFRKRVCGEVRHINELFPEYTPHDEEYHLKKLFHVADMVLETDGLESMNSVELFVLAVALYGHDWGMAVSNPEKQYIIDGVCPEGTKPQDIWVLPDEQERFNNFAKKQNLKKEGDRFTEIPTGIWSEYVRITHAIRSGERVRRYFQAIDGGVADAASRVCEGHWLDFEDLQDFNRYPTDFSVLRETINIRALSVYLRLIDLLDLGEDRTPYVIWKFVAPRNAVSKMEWAKHRALRPVTCPPYQDGRIIRVDGSTDDNEVYAALQDFRIWCEEQLRGSNDTLALMNDPRHKLNIYHIDWRVAARGFKPVSIQFEFNRNRMFEILGDDIYQGDSYVFLRELLQNSIDAIRMRREILKRKEIEPKNLGVIYVDVKHRENGDATVTWRDDGIGMNEYIVRSYLAVAGNSYYRSADFEREGLKMDPISRFGIGILSCFMIADRIEIDTYRDPYMPPASDPLKIIIPSMKRQFRIEPGTKEAAKVGTTIRVFIDGKKLPEDEDDKIKPLDVTAYLSIVAGFVEFPIIVTEGEKNTIILHPKHDDKDALERFGETFQVHKIDLGFPWSEVFFPQDLPIVHEMLSEQSLDIASDLGIEGYEGTITYPVPVSFEKDFISLSSTRFGEGGVRVLLRGQFVVENKRIRWRDFYQLYQFEMVEKKAGLSRSSIFSPLYSVYRDGILISSATLPRILEMKEKGIGYAWMCGRLVVNIPKSKAPKVDLARTELLEKNKSWDLPITHTHSQYVLNTFLKDLLSQEPSERFYRMGHISAYYTISPESIWEVLANDHWPIPLLETGGKLHFTEWKDIKMDLLYLAPYFLMNELEELFRLTFFSHKKYEGNLLKWKGERSILYLYHQRQSNAIGRALNLLHFFIEKFYHADSIRFLHPDSTKKPPIYQEIWMKTEASEEVIRDEEELLMKAIETPNLLNSTERARLKKVFPYQNGFPEFVNFEEPFEQAFGYGLEILNFNHPTIQVLIQYQAFLELTARRKTLEDDRIGYMKDIFSDHFTGYYGEEYDLKQFSDGLRKILSIAQEYRLFDIDNIEKLIPTPDEFVPGTVFEKSKGNFVISSSSDRLDKSTKIENYRTFGKPMTKKSMVRHRK